jgi:hypothetical protein
MTDGVVGQRIPDHYVLQLLHRDGEALRKVLEDAQGDDQFPLNEFEEEVVGDVLAILAQPSIVE